MRHKRHPYRLCGDIRQALFNLWEMTMPIHAVGFETVRHLAEQVVYFGLSPRAANTRC